MREALHPISASQVLLWRPRHRISSQLKDQRVLPCLKCTIRKFLIDFCLTPHLSDNLLGFVLLHTPVTTLPFINISLVVSWIVL